jgi:Na+/melibiose symporter-like transporter
MLPLAIFASRQFSAINVITFCVYCATAGELFMLVLELQAGAGFSALAAGSALLPVTVLMIVLSPRSAALAERIGPRWPITAGAAICAGGLLLALRIGVDVSYLSDVLPAVVLFGVGIALIVSPLTATVLASADVRNAGVASGVNNAVTRVAGLIAVAGLPAAVGLGANAYHAPAVLTAGFHLAMIICAGLLALAALLAVTLIDDHVLRSEPAARVTGTVSGRRR